MADNVHKLKTLRSIPEPQIPLGTDEALRQYRAHGRTLLEAGKLTAAKHSQLSMWAVHFDEVLRLRAENKPLRASLLDKMRKSFNTLGIEEDGAPYAGTRETEANPFEKFGAPARRRRKVHEGAVRPS
jgi:hypothetical protein